MTRRRWLALAAVVAVLLLGGRLVADAWVDYRWYDALGPGALAVWRARIADLALLRGMCALLAGTFAFVNLVGVATSVEALVLPRRLGNLEIGVEIPGRRLIGTALVLAIVLGALLSLPMGNWTGFDLVTLGPLFGEIEPFTGHDLAFFVYWLPFENALFTWALLTLLAVATLVIVLYAVTPGLRWDRGRLRASRHVRRHLTVLGVVLLLLLAWGHRLDAYSLYIGGSGAGGAFTLVDDAVGVPARFALAIATAIGALIVLRAGWAGQARLAFWVVSAVVVATLAVRLVVPAVGTRMLAHASAPRAEAYVATRALLTQRGFGVDRIQRLPTGSGYADGAAAASAVPVWDPAVLARAVERARRSGVIVGDVGWQWDPQGLAAVLAERPSSAASPDSVPEWTVVVASGTRSDARGAPVLIDRPPADAGELGVRVGALVHPDAVGAVVVSDPAGRVVGDPVQGRWERLAHAWSQRDVRLAFTDALDAVEAPKLVRHRDVRERVQALAPFFAQGHTLVPALVGDTLYWVLHLYVATSWYPHAQHYGMGGEDRSYFHPAAVALVNAESGAVRLVAAVQPEPIAAHWIRRFPLLFTEPGMLPRDLAGAIPPATDAALVQAWAFAQYGARDERTPPLRRVPGGDGGDSTLGVGPRALLAWPAIVRAAASSGATPTARDSAATDTAARIPAWTLPLLDGSDRVSGVLVAVGGARPGTQWIPATPGAPRWRAVLDRLRRGETAASDSEAESALPATPTDVGATSPPAAQGTAAVDVTTLRGRVRAVPLETGVQYVQPSYLVAREGIPALTRVAVLVDDSLRAGRTYADAVGAGAPPAPGRPGPVPVDALARARAAYDALQGALRRGAWARVGAALDSLGAALGRAAP